MSSYWIKVCLTVARWLELYLQQMIAGMAVATKVDIVKNAGKMKQTTQFLAVE